MKHGFIWAGRMTQVHRMAGNYLATFCLEDHMRVLSVFIDETGDFGAYDKNAPYYCVALVLHDQSVDITANISALDQHVSNLGYQSHTIHVGPIIRRENFYVNDTREIRRSLFNSLFHFARRVDIHYLCPFVDKKLLDSSNETAMQAALTRSIASSLRDNWAFFSAFDRIIVYYDNGQNELRKVLVSVFNTLFTNVEFRKIKPSDYRLQQVADLICTLELIKMKFDSKEQSKSEQDFFYSRKDFYKNIYKYICSKKL